jgi:tRNA(fMet)-specific endonuclease VapC
MHLLDTNILTAMHTGHPKVTKAFSLLDDPEIATTIVNRVELLQGRFDFLLKAEPGEQILRAQLFLRETEALLDGMQIVPFEILAVNQFDQLNQVSSLRKIGRADLLIASIALANRATLVTRNLKDFRRVPGLKLVNWFD